MSKRSWLPTQKGTDLFPKATYRPTKLVVRGVPADIPLHDAVLQRFGGHLKQFHGKQQQAYSLSGNPIQRGHIEWVGARATYTNIQGQEVLELEVDIELLKEIKKKLPKTPYDWAVIDLHVPIFTHTYDDDGRVEGSQTVVIARAVVPKLTDDDESPLVATPLKGEAGTMFVDYAYYYSSEEPPVLQWAGSTGLRVDDSVATPEYIGSLLVDLRNLNMNDVVDVELYAAQGLMPSDSIFTVGDQAGYYIIQRASTPDELVNPGPGPTPATLTSTTGPQPIGTPNPYADYQDQSALPADYPIPHDNRGGGDAATPALTIGDFTEVFFDYYQGGMITVDEPQGAAYYTGDHTTYDEWEFHENVLHYEFYPVYNWSTPSRDIDPTPQIGWIEAAMFMGTPLWGWSFTYDAAVVNDVSWSLWEDANAFPRRFVTGRIAHSVEVPLIDTVPDLYGLKLLGKLHILPKLGSVTFEPVT